MIKIISIKRTELTAVEPLTLAEVKNHLNITDSDNNTKLTGLITQCRRTIEEFCNISIINKRVVLLAEFQEEWELPYGPVTGLEGVESRDSTIGSGMPSYKTLESGWQLEGDNFWAGFGMGDWFGWQDYESRIRRTPGWFWQRLRLTYTVGYDVVPQDLKLGILNEIAYRYTHLGDMSDNIISINEEAKKLVQPYMKLIWL